MERFGVTSRKTGETDVETSILIDGEGLASLSTGIGFFDHMLNLLAKHGLFDINVDCKGDLEVDAHHSVEDVGICFGQAMPKSTGQQSGHQTVWQFYRCDGRGSGPR